MKRIFLLALIFVSFLAIKSFADGEPVYCDQNGNCWYKGESGSLYDNKGNYLYPRDDSGSAQGILAGMGAVPAGSRPKTVIQEGGQPGYHQTDPTSNLKREIESRKEDSFDSSSMIEYLMSKGYSKEEAFELVYQIEHGNHPK